MKKKSDYNREKKKALFLQRFIAFLIDIFIVSFIVALISTPFVNSKKIESLNDKSYELIEKFRNKEIDTNEYVAEYLNISYDLSKSSGMITIINIVISLLYYVLFVLKNNGQTLGKKLLKIKIVSTDSELTTNQLIFRSFIANSILINFLSVMLLLCVSKSVYFYCYFSFSIIQYIITIISVFMIIYSKSGMSIHDRIAHTKVIKC